MRQSTCFSPSEHALAARPLWFWSRCRRSPVRVVEQSLQAITKRGREAGGPGRVKKADANHVQADECEVATPFEFLSFGTIPKNEMIERRKVFNLEEVFGGKRRCLTRSLTRSWLQNGLRWLPIGGGCRWRSFENKRPWPLRSATSERRWPAQARSGSSPRSKRPALPRRSSGPTSTRSPSRRFTRSMAPLV